MWDKYKYWKKYESNLGMRQYKVDTHKRTNLYTDDEMGSGAACSPEPFRTVHLDE